MIRENLDEIATWPMVNSSTSKFMVLVFIILLLVFMFSTLKK